ncbi:uncharacterized protein LOC110033111 [Phalaenopsis equestris]|uniref:uncharacterized protein LOC110033111 n=1 Tax=Phalaenopsis equestris TaxID=78828 RepID=UPI0009E5AECA|nr:uncharacterized protein LOC110033111 [Phalaenopsis equestris]
MNHSSVLHVLDLASNHMITGKIPLVINSMSPLKYLGLSKNNIIGTILPSLTNLSFLESFYANDNHLEGGIPPEIGVLHKLKDFYVFNNKLSGNIPSSFYNMSSLREVSVANNNLSGFISANIAQAFPNLEFFSFAENNFIGSLDQALQNVSSLVVLDISENNFIGMMPPDLGKMYNLIRLNLAYNQLEANDATDWRFLDSLTNCTNLQFLGLDHNKLRGRLPKSFGNLSIELQEITLGSNHILGRIPFELDRYTNLIGLGMERNHLEGSIPETIRMLGRLQILTFYGNDLTGSIPNSLENLTRLNKLDLGSNQLTGHIPSCLKSLQLLNWLYLGHNNLTGWIPREIFLIPSLSIILDVSYNSLTGSLPLEVGHLINLLYLDFSNNNLRGEIPKTLGSCQSLLELNTEYNFFQGPIPISLGSVKSLEILDLSHNNLSGAIPQFLQKLTFLRNLNLSFNNLEGEVPYEGVFANSSEISLVGNEKLCGGILTLHLPKCVDKSSSKKPHYLIKILSPILSIVVLLFILLLYYTLLYRRKKKNDLRNASGLSLSPPFPKISYAQLVEATNSFSTTHLVGCGRYGSVFAGNLSDYDATVAIKVFNLEVHGALKSFTYECDALRSIRHRNLVRVLSSCSSLDIQGNEFKALIFEFMPKGNLDTHLHQEYEIDEDVVLSLEKRLSIAINVAEALEYLHHSCEPPIIHCDIKPSNILLDNNLIAHVGDFGLSRMLYENVNISLQASSNQSGIKGTIGYIAPENGEVASLSPSADVYSFGIVLLEMLTRTRPTDDVFNDNLTLHNHIKRKLPHGINDIVDLKMFTKEQRDASKAGGEQPTWFSCQSINKCLLSLIELGLSCSVSSPKERPSMKDVTAKLHAIEVSYIVSRLLIILLSVCLSAKQLFAVGRNNTDYESLIAFKNLFLKQSNMNSSTIFASSWNVTNHFCSWEGVTCGFKHRDRVTALDLHSVGLAGPLPPSIFNLTFLRRLDLSLNELYGDIPQILACLPRLQHLNLSFNSFDGDIHDILTMNHSSVLQVLDLNSNHMITGKMPHVINSMSPLKYLNLNENNIIGTIPTSLTNLSFLETVNTSFYNLSSLQIVTVTKNRLSGYISTNIAQAFPNLQAFLIGVNNFVGSLDQALQNVTSLVLLEVSKNNFTGVVPPDLGKMYNLVYLNMGENQFEANDEKEWRFLNSLTNCTILQTLGLSGNNLRGRLPKSFGNLSMELQRIKLGYNHILGRIPFELDSGIKGTIGYIAPEYGEVAPLSPSADVYSFGIVLLEMLTGRRPTDDVSDNLSLHNYIKTIFPHGINHIVDLKMFAKERRDDSEGGGEQPRWFSCQSTNKCLLSLIKLGLACSVSSPKERPSMKDVTAKLHAIRVSYVPSIYSMVEIISVNRLLIILFSVCLSSKQLLAIGRSHTDYESLVAFKNQVLKQSNVDSFIIFASSWNATNHFCSWEGVTCSYKHRYRVTALDLHSVGLVGPLPPSIFNLTFLRRLDLSDNKLYGEIPPILACLPRLQNLNLSFNSFDGDIHAILTINHSSVLQVLDLNSNHMITGKMPLVINSMLPLKYLNLNENKIIGTIPPSLTNLSFLETFYASYNHLEGGIPPEIGVLQKLKHFNVAVNKLSGNIPSSFYNISSLLIVSVTNNYFSGYISANIAQAFPNLQAFLIGINNFLGSLDQALQNVTSLLLLDISRNNFIGVVPPDLGKMHNLKNLAMGSNQLEASDAKEWRFLDSLANCTGLQMLPKSFGNLSIKLQQITLGANDILGRIPFELDRYTNLIALGMELNLLEGPIPETIGMLGRLQALFFDGNDLTGIIPYSLENLTGLSELDLRSNQLTGPIPSSLKNLQHLSYLDLSQNNLTGGIPRDIFFIPSFSFALYLSYNFFTGTLPVEVGLLINLVYLDFSNNNLSGEIPKTLGSCQSLRELNMGYNFFQGPIPISLSSLTSLEILDLSHNNLSGVIPQFLQNFISLMNLNLSFNNLEGEVPYEGVFSNSSEISLIGNEKLCGGILTLHLPKCVAKSSSTKSHHLIKILFPILTIVVMLFILLLCYTLLYRRKRKNDLRNASGLSLSPPYPKISYAKLVEATNAFSTTHLVGCGRYGSVYAGNLREYNVIVAIKVFNLEVRGALRSFTDECDALRSIRHRNLVRVLSSCSSIDIQGNEFKALIFEFMSNGNLDTWLHQKHEIDEDDVLSLEKRLSIAIDVAEALEYLHHSCEPPIIHCDIKPSNILLDENIIAHVGDFGLSRMFYENLNISRQDYSYQSGIKGTIGYIAPEYGEVAPLSPSADFYSFGIVLLEMLTGRSWKKAYR